MINQSVKHRDKYYSYAVKVFFFLLFRKVALIGHLGYIYIWIARPKEAPTSGRSPNRKCSSFQVALPWMSRERSAFGSVPFHRTFAEFVFLSRRWTPRGSLRYFGTEVPFSICCSWVALLMCTHKVYCCRNKWKGLFLKVYFNWKFLSNDPNGLMESVVVGAKLGIFGCFEMEICRFYSHCFVSSILVRFTQSKSVKSV